ncbi:hypothetical protein KOI35_15750 [Actinoplanes bogorensis]|uniref:Uncharacterized protein n=1 Tax=Paractinoplanes bogorensis TaxID=1610840 RepID=A0ABS5YND8_9ACTN|nr:hypothetical protein [Actinoplanes bogorensis]MBU2664957.1 hypothetical protein [Actinoplanes bogorensis]
MPVKGQIVHSPAGDEIVLDEVGQTVLLDNPVIRVWDVALEPGETHPWHLHHNPYVVLSISGSEARMDWLDGSEPRFLNEYRGGSVYRPLSPVHRLTNIGQRFYQNRLVELKDLGENRPEPADIGPGDRSIEGQPPAPALPDGRVPVILHPHVGVWTVASDEPVKLDLADRPHVIAELARDGAVSFHPGGPLTLTGEYFVVDLAF